MKVFRQIFINLYGTIIYRLSVGSYKLKTFISRLGRHTTKVHLFELLEGELVLCHGLNNFVNNIDKQVFNLFVIV